MRRDIEFTSGGDTVRGWLYTPDAVDGPWPVIVMAGGWCYVKELVQPHYAQVFADAGFAALLFDYRNFGERRRRAASTSTRTSRSRTTRTRSRSPRRSTRSTPTASASGASPTAAATSLILGATDPRVSASRRRSRSSTATATCAASTARSASASSSSLIDDRAGASRRARTATSRMPRPIRHRGLHVAVPGDLRDVPRAQGSARRRPTRTAARSSRPSCSCTTASTRSSAVARHADAGGRRRERRPHALGPRDRRLQPDPDRRRSAWSSSATRRT